MASVVIHGIGNIVARLDYRRFRPVCEQLACIRGYDGVVHGARDRSSTCRGRDDADVNNSINIKIERLEMF